MRVFIAIEFEDYIKDELWKSREKVKELSLKGNFTAKDNFHLTLKFIGEANSNQIDKLKSAINEVAQNRIKFSLNFKDIGSFKKGNKEIIWVGIKRDERLENLHKDLENILEKSNFEKDERSYRPHITLGRQIVLKDKNLKLSENVIIPKEKIEVTKISLMESTRVDGKLVYRPLYICFIEGEN